MKVLPSILRTVLPALAVAFMIQACSGTTAMTRQLLSVSISPSAATAQGAQVQFVATGTYNTEPYTVTPLTATWGVNNYPQATAATTQDGLVTCNQGASGTVIVEAWVVVPPGPVCNVIDGAGRPCGSVGGSAQITCP